MKVTITLTLPDDRWFALASHAEARDRKIADVITDEVMAGITKLIGPEGDGRGPNPYAKNRPYRDSPRRAICRRMWGNGHSISAIAATIGTTNKHKVAATLWDLGFDTTAARRVRRPADERLRPYLEPIPVFPPTRRGRPPKEETS